MPCHLNHLLNFALGLIPSAEWIFVPSMFTADEPVGSSKRTLGFSGSLQLRNKVFHTELYIVFTKCDLHAPPLPERNILTLTPLCLAYSLTQLWTILTASRCLEFREFLLSKISSSAMIFVKKFGIAEFLFDSGSYHLDHLSILPPLLYFQFGQEDLDCEAY